METPAPSFQEEVDVDFKLINDLTQQQERWLSLLPVLPSILSVIGSGIILYVALFQQPASTMGRPSNNSHWSVTSSTSQAHPQRRRRLKQQLTPYKRVLLGMSMWDILVSITYPFWAFGVPSSYDRYVATRHIRVWAFGNRTTCTAIGFFTQCCVCGVIYHGMLSYYFLLTVRHGKSNNEIAKSYEPWMHAVPVGFATITSVIGLAMGFFRENNLGIGCWIADYPEDCHLNPDVECTSYIIGWVYGGIPVFISLGCIIANNLRIYVHVRRTIQHSRQRSNVGLNSSDAQMRRIQAVAVQALLYVASFAATYAGMFILRIMESNATSTEQGLFPILVLQAVTLPMNGFFNALVFVRPKYLRARNDFANEGRWWAVKRAILGDTVDPVSDDNNGHSKMPQQMARFEKYKVTEATSACMQSANLAASMQTNTQKQLLDEEEEKDGTNGTCDIGHESWHNEGSDRKISHDPTGGGGDATKDGKDNQQLALDAINGEMREMGSDRWKDEGSSRIMLDTAAGDDHGSETNNSKDNVDEDTASSNREPAGRPRITVKEIQEATMAQRIKLQEMKEKTRKQIG